ncbi:MAG: hypothetical protein U0V75_17895 [Ferruginibacter sp.]
MLADENILSFNIAISPYPADGILSAFVVIFIISFSISSGSGLDIKKYQHSSKLWPLTASQPRAQSRATTFSILFRRVFLTWRLIISFFS